MGDWSVRIDCAAPGPATSGSLSTVEIIGIAIGVVAGIAIFGGLGWWYCRQRAAEAAMEAKSMALVPAYPDPVQEPMHARRTRTFITSEMLPISYCLQVFWEEAKSIHSSVLARDT